MKTYTKLEIIKALKETYKYMLIHDSDGDTGYWRVTLRSFCRNLDKIKNGEETKNIETFE